MNEQADAAASLQGIARIEAKARGRSGWYTAYLWMFAGWQLVLVPAVLLWHGPVGATVSALANAAVVVGLSWFATRQPVVPRGHVATHLSVIGAWAAAYVLALVLGLTVFPDSVPFAVAAALVCALPAAVAARREVRAV
ncbi:hypothetical protein [Streptomyces sp. A0592]|uniref:hypothetical protein n=1 Tax=Streptomyces sp. A0592 TaxID=2563099 RepID=UPI00109EA1F4|nr:hypothetical protein [Streptomyces sp. A0592]THA86221.1 hypothetical protein E6U81_04305 [Streptomyces sp. A0592]